MSYENFARPVVDLVAWAPSTVYSAGNIVGKIAGGRWQCLTAHTSGTTFDFTKWTFLGSVAPTLNGSISGMSKIKPTSWTVALVGIDYTAGVLYALDLNNGILRASYDNGTTWDNTNKGIPTGSLWSTVIEVIRGGAYLYTSAGPATSGTTVATGGASSGATSIPLVASVSVGAHVIGSGSTQETVFVTSVTGSGPYTANLDAPLANNHLAAETVVAGVALYQATPVASGATMTWTKVMTCTRGVQAKNCQLSADASYIYYAEYGDPNGSVGDMPSLWRSPIASGTAWTRIYGPQSGIRHFHAIEPDPYVPGSIWVTAGDGVPYTVMHSPDYGTTWSVVVGSANWQSVQISFAPDYVYLAGDSGNTDLTVIDRATYTPRSGCPTLHRNIAPVGAPATNVYAANAYFGAVDPATGIFYVNIADTGAGTWSGVFYVPAVGQPLQVFDKGGDSTSWSMNYRVYVYNGYVYAGQWRAPLLAVV